MLAVILVSDFVVALFCFLRKMKANGPARQKLGQGRHFWQWAKPAWLSSDLFQVLKGYHLSALGSQQRGL